MVYPTSKKERPQFFGHCSKLCLMLPNAEHSAPVLMYARDNGRALPNCNHTSWCYKLLRQDEVYQSLKKDLFPLWSTKKLRSGLPQIM